MDYSELVVRLDELGKAGKAAGIVTIWDQAAAAIRDLLAERDKCRELGAREAIAEVVATILDAVRSFQDGDGYFLASQIRVRLDRFERGEHLGEAHG